MLNLAAMVVWDMIYNGKVTIFIAEYLPQTTEFSENTTCLSDAFKILHFDQHMCIVWVDGVVQARNSILHKRCWLCRETWLHNTAKRDKC
jgi:hypothetical protein